MFCKKCGKEFYVFYTDLPETGYCAECFKKILTEQADSQDYQELRLAIEKSIPSYTGKAFFSLFCCFPLGILALVYANITKKRILEGDFNGAIKASEKACTWSDFALIWGINVIVLGFLFRLLFFVAD